MACQGPSSLGQVIVQSVSWCTHRSDVWSDSAGLWVRHEPPGPQQAPQLGCLGHHVGRGHQLVKVPSCPGNLLDQLLSAHKVCAGLLAAATFSALQMTATRSSLPAGEARVLSRQNQAIAHRWLSAHQVLTCCQQPLQSGPPHHNVGEWPCRRQQPAASGLSACY